MNRESLKQLGCPSCRQPFVPTVFEADDCSVQTAILCCPGCNIAAPLINGFPLFDLARPGIPSDPDNWCAEIQNKIFTEKEYITFLEEKSRRQYTDSYAAFHPFNESTRSLYPFIELLRESLKPGDLILDTWCRTGWSGELLASLFPEQRIISIWEGNTDVLGYNGFNFWLKKQQRADNWDIVFSHADHPLPFLDQSFSLIHGLDSLHRYRHSSFIPECLRISKEKANLIFPHIHLTNSEPEPYFDRGCQQYSGKEWKAWLDSICKNGPRTGWVFSEKDLFTGNSKISIGDDSDTPHYNGLIYIGDSSNAGRSLEPKFSPPLLPSTKLLTNPFISVDIFTREISLENPTLAKEATESLLLRHRCYQEVLDKVIGKKLSVKEHQLLWLSDKKYTLAESAKILNIDFAAVQKLASDLCTLEVTHPTNVSDAMYDLQRFYSEVTLREKKVQTFSELWEQYLPKYGDQLVVQWLADESEFSTDDLTYLVDSIGVALYKSGLSVGNRVAIVSEHHIEALLVCWAAWLYGLVTVLPDAASSKKEVNEIVDQYEVKAFFSDKPDLIKHCLAPRKVLFDIDKDEAFSNWLAPHLGQIQEKQEIAPEAEAAILFTSGTTGKPKGVIHSQKSLCLSGHTIVDSFEWHKDRILSIGPLSMMSGLRNPAIASLLSTSTILLPDSSCLRLPISVWENAVDFDATVITSTPAWLQGVRQNEKRLRAFPSLRQIAVTGSNLSDKLRNRAGENLEVEIINYYGITETGGICLVSKDYRDGESIGKPAEALIQVRNKEGEGCGPLEPGELWVFSEQLMSGYFNNVEATQKAIQDGWYRTGDIVTRNGDKQITLIGRTDDALKLRSGLRIYPHNLEHTLESFVGIREAAVTVLMPEQLLVALVIAGENYTAPIELLKEQHPNLPLPDQVQLVTSLPRNSNGKIIRSQLAALAKNP